MGFRPSWLALSCIPTLACSRPTVAPDDPPASPTVAVEREPGRKDRERRCPTLIPHPNGQVVGRNASGYMLPQHLAAAVERLELGRALDHMLFDGDCDGEVEAVLLTLSASDEVCLWWVDREHAIDLVAEAGLEKAGDAVPQLLADGTPIVVLFDGQTRLVYGRVAGESFVVHGRVDVPAGLHCEHEGIGIVQRADGRFAYFHRPIGGPEGAPCEAELVVIDLATLTAAVGEPVSGDPDFEVLPTTPGRADVARTHALELERCHREVLETQPPFVLRECGGVRFSEVEFENPRKTADGVIDASMVEITGLPGYTAVADRELAAPELDGLGPIDRVALIRGFIDDVPARLDWHVITPRPSGQPGVRLFQCSHDVMGSIWGAPLMASSRAMCLGTVAARLSAEAR